MRESAGAVEHPPLDERWNEREGYAVVDEWRRSGQSAVEFCGRRKITTQRLRYWSERLEKAEKDVQSPEFLVFPLKTGTETPASKPPTKPIKQASTTAAATPAKEPPIKASTDLIGVEILLDRRVAVRLSGTTSRAALADALRAVLDVVGP